MGSINQSLCVWVSHVKNGFLSRVGTSATFQKQQPAMDGSYQQSFWIFGELGCVSSLWGPWGCVQSVNNWQKENWCFSLGAKCCFSITHCSGFSVVSTDRQESFCSRVVSSLDPCDPCARVLRIHARGQNYKIDFSGRTRGKKMARTRGTDGNRGPAARQWARPWRRWTADQHQHWEEAGTKISPWDLEETGEAEMWHSADNG